jgi:hypothetical protein
MTKTVSIMLAGMLLTAGPVSVSAQEDDQW